MIASILLALVLTVLFLSPRFVAWCDALDERSRND